MQQDLVYQSLAVLVATAGLALLYWAMFRDRSRGRRRCPKCWYDLRGSDSLTCPECGYTARRERQFYKTRRRRRWTGAAALLVLTGSWILPEAMRHGWLSLAPTPVLIAILPHLGEEGTKALRQRWNDINDESMAAESAGWQVRFAQWQARRSVRRRYDLETRQAMMDLLLWLDTREPLGDTILSWLSDTDASVKRAALMVVGFVNLEPVDEQAIASKLCELMGDSNESVSMFAALALRRFVNDDPAAVESLVLGLQDTSSGVRHYSAIALRELDVANPKALESLGDLILSGDKAAARAADALGEIGDSTSAASLVHGVGSPDAGVRYSSARALLQLGPAVQAEQVADSLGLLLDHVDPGVRAGACAALLGQGSLAEKHMAQMVHAIEATNVADLMVCIRPAQRWDGATTVPVLLAIAQCCVEAARTDPSFSDPATQAITMMRIHPDQFDQMIPYLESLLFSPHEWLRENAAVTLGCFGTPSQSVLPSLRQVYEHSQSPREKRVLSEVIAALEPESTKK